MGDNMRNKSPRTAPDLNPLTIKARDPIAAKTTPIMKRS
jgi:hypothetical protein